MADEQENDHSDDVESAWKSIMEKVRKENKLHEKKSIEEPQPLVTKPDVPEPKPIEKPPIDNTSIDRPIDRIPEQVPKESLSGKPRFTTIMITSELKQRLASRKGPKESYGDVIKKLLEQ